MSGSTIGGAVGAVVGFWVTGGNPQGAQWGWMIGSAVGGYVDPTQVFGPRLQDTRGQSSAVGGAIPRAWGTAPVPGNIIWQQPGVTEHRHTDDGKGSGTEQVTFSYTRSYAIMFHLGEIAGVLQIKRNGKIVYDVRDDDTLTQEWVEAGNDLVDAFRYLSYKRAENAKFINKCTIYTGTQTQEPDPTIEAYKGVGNASAYRGRAYFVVTDDETQAGEIAQYEIIVAACGTVTTSPASGLSDWFIVESRLSGSSLSPSEDGVDWSSLSTVNFDASFNRSFATHRRLILWAELADMNPYYTDDRGVTLHELPSPGGVSGGSYGAKYIDGRLWIPGGVYGTHYTNDEGDSWDTLARANHATIGAIDDYFIAGNSTLLIRGGAGGSLSKSTDGGDTWGLSARPFEPSTHPDLRCGDTDGSIVVVGGSSDSLLWTSDGLTYTNCTLPGGLGSGTFVRVIAPVSVDEKWMAFRTAGADSTNSILTSLDGKTWALATGYAAFTVSGGAQCAIRHDGRVTVIGTSASDDQVIITTTDEGATWIDCADSIPTGNALISISGPPNQWAAESGSTQIPDAPGWYVDQNGNVQGPGGTTVITPCSTTTVGEIVADLCNLSGLASAEYDVSQLTDTLDGYVIARETDAASVIESLRPIGMFDPAEWDGKLRFIKRGGTAVGSINGDDLVERDGDAFEREMVQEVELLRKVSVGYLDSQAAWAPNTQAWERRVGTINARGESVVEVTAVMGADQAATIAKRKGLTSWGEPEKQKYSLPYRLAKYTPTDILNYTDDDGEVQLHRMMQIEDDSGVRYVESASNCAEAYNATATGVTPKPPTITNESLRGPTLAVYMNLPSLRTSDNVPGVYIAACGLLAGWQGAAILLSVDGGVSYQQVTTFNVPSSMGRLTAACTASSEPISVSMDDGQLSSITADQLITRQNAFAITTNDVSELGQFQTATAGGDDAYALTDTVRGVLGTTAASHATGDAFVMVATAKFVPLDIGLAGRTLYFKAVTFGTSEDAAEAVPFVFNPLFTTVIVEAYTDDAGNTYADDADNVYYYEASA